MKGIVGFVVGVATGAAATWYVTKKYYQMIADEEIESVKRDKRKMRITDVSKLVSELVSSWNSVLMPKNILIKCTRAFDFLGMGIVLSKFGTGKILCLFLFREECCIFVIVKTRK